MGNEFGHPEWIDFPREGNGWSYAHARRQWSLAGNGFLRYAWLGDFDKAMIKLVKRYKVLAAGYAWNLVMDECNKTMAFAHGDLLFVFNWHPRRRFPTTSCPCRRPANTCPCSRPTNGVSAGRSGRRWTASTSRSRRRTGITPSGRISASTILRARRRYI